MTAVDEPDGALAATLTAVLARHPALARHGVDFRAHATRAVAAGARPEHLDDLLIAWAAARGEPVGLRAVEALLVDLGPAVRRIDGAPAFLDELRQELRVRMLVAGADGPPRIAAYAGRGPLRAWLQVAATRLALDGKRRKRPAVVPADVLGELAGCEPDPELRSLKQRYRAELAAALGEALAALPERPRALLRLHFVEGLRLAELGRLYQVHESTMSRWVRDAAAAVAADAQVRLSARLALAPEAASSIARLVASQLDLSIARLLG